MQYKTMFSIVIFRRRHNLSILTKVTKPETYVIPLFLNLEIFISCKRNIYITSLINTRTAIYVTEE